MTMLPMDNLPGIPMQPDALPQFNRGGMFGGLHPDWKNVIAGALSGYLASRGNPAGAAGLQMLMQRRLQQQRDHQYEQRRQQALQDQMALYDYKRANPEAPNNDTVADYNFRVQTLGKEAADEWLRNPPQYMQVPGVGIVQIPRMAAPQGAPTAPVGKLTPINGGPTPQASGGFPY